MKRGRLSGLEKEKILDLFAIDTSISDISLSLNRSEDTITKFLSEQADEIESTAPDITELVGPVVEENKAEENKVEQVVTEVEHDKSKSKQNSKVKTRGQRAVTGINTKTNSGKSGVAIATQASSDIGDLFTQRVNKLPKNIPGAYPIYDNDN